MKLLLFLLISINCYSQSVSISEGVAFNNVVVAPAATTEYQGAVKFTSGVSFNLKVDCALPCAGTIQMLGSNDNINYEVIPQVSQGFSASATYLYNIYNVKFLYYKITVSNTGLNDFVLYGYHAEKSQL